MTKVEPSTVETAGEQLALSPVPRQRPLPDADRDGPPRQRSASEPVRWQPAELPPHPGRSYLWPALTMLLVVGMLLAVGGAAAAAVALRADNGITGITWVDMRPIARGAEVQALLSRRAKAVVDKDLAAFMADVDQSDATFASRQKVLFGNLTRVPFAELRLQEHPPAKELDVARFLPASLLARHRGAAYVAAVAVHHRIEGIDSRTVVVPWLPVLAYTGGRWQIVGQADGSELPVGANGQPWDAAGEIQVQRSKRVMVVLSAEDAARGPYLLNLAERSLDRVAVVRPGGWDGKVLLTAVQDRRIFETYFADSPERVNQFEALAVPHYDRVPGWDNRPTFAGTRIVFNPQQLNAPAENLALDLTHEFAHAAMGPVTSGYTPYWVKEGFAEYVSYKGTTLSSDRLKQRLSDIDLAGGLPVDDAFYDRSSNYVVAYLACRLIAERHGQAKLIEFYEAFQRMSAQENVFEATLGVRRVDFERDWRAYVGQYR